MQILRFPLVRFTLAFIPGIICGYYSKPDLSALLSITIFSFATLSLAFASARRQFQQKIYFGLLLIMTAFFCGALTQSAHVYYNQRGHYINVGKESDSNIILILAERLKNSTSSIRYIADVQSVDGIAAHGKILLHFKTPVRLPIGSRIIAQGKIIPNAKPLNPAQFDYGKYLDDKSIPAQCYLRDNYKVLGTDKNLAYHADGFRNKMISTLRQYGFREPELQVLHALVLGQQQEIAPEIVKEYQFAGAVHILSVSGLHVGFVLLFINAVLSRLPKTNKWNLFKLGLTLFALWSFAFVAGLAPSVVRSATMFSFVAIGMNLRRSTNTFHTLVISLLLILFFEPAFLFDVGFQLSYAALFFILWLQPLFSGIWSPGSRIVNYFWEILTVSFAAQIGTLPLSIYYFHQFPALFFVTNLVVIPMLSVIMPLGIVVMLPAAFNCIVPVLTPTLENGIKALNYSIRQIASFEQFVLTDISCNLPIMLTGYFAIIAVIVWFKSPSNVKLTASILALFVFQGSIIGSIWRAESQSEFIVFNVSKSTLIVKRQGRGIYAFGDLGRNINYAIANFGTIQQLPLRNTFWFHKKKILLWNRNFDGQNINADVVILSNSPKVNLDRWLKDNRPEIIVADASNFKTDVARWTATCRKQKIPFHYTKEKGFYKLSD